MGLTYHKIIVTGGAGFIGIHAVDALLQNEADVWVLDDPSSGHLRNLKKGKTSLKLHFRRGSGV